MGNSWGASWTTQKKRNKKKTASIEARPQRIIPQMYANQRQVIYSYLRRKELIKVASLSKRERESVLNSRIVKEDGDENFDFSLKASEFYKYWNKSAVNGLIMAIKLSNTLVLTLNKCHMKVQLHFKQFFPFLIAAVAKVGNKLVIIDGCDDGLNGIVVDEIEKSGALIDQLHVKESENLLGLLATVKYVGVAAQNSEWQNRILNVIETYNEFPNLKVLYCYRDILANAFLARSQLQEFEVGDIQNEPVLLQLLATQTQLKKVELKCISDAAAFITVLPPSVEYFSFVSTQNNKEQLLVLLLNCTVKHIQVENVDLFDYNNLDKLLYSYLDPAQKSQGNRTRNFYQWKFQVSTKNRILHPQRPPLY